MVSTHMKRKGVPPLRNTKLLSAPKPCGNDITASRAVGAKKTAGTTKTKTEREQKAVGAQKTDGITRQKEKTKGTSKSLKRSFFAI